MDAHLTSEIAAYQNLADFLRYRGYRVEREPYRPPHAATAPNGLTELEETKGIINRLNMWMLVGSRDSAEEPGKRDLFVIHLLQTDGKYTHMAQDFSRLLGTSKTVVEQGEVLREVVVLADDAVMRKKHLQAAMGEFRKSLPGVLCSMHPYCMFAEVVPDNPLVPKHEIISAAEAGAFMKRFHFTKDQLPVLNAQADPMVVWCGARPGDFVRVHRVSRTAAALTEVVRLVK